MTRQEIYASITLERARQERLKRDGKFRHTCADNVPNANRLAVLAEEFGEVARIVCEGIEAPLTPRGLECLRDELVQVAAVCTAWLEALDGEP